MFFEAEKPTPLYFINYSGILHKTISDENVKSQECLAEQHNIALWVNEENKFMCTNIKSSIHIYFIVSKGETVKRLRVKPTCVLLCYPWDIKP